jgi:hypothetical protein
MNLLDAMLDKAYAVFEECGAETACPSQRTAG